MRRLFVILVFFTTLLLKAQVSDFDSVNFTRADNIAKLNEGQKLENLPILAYNLTNKLNTDVEKFRAIFYWVCNNIAADDSQNSKVINARKKLQNDSLAFIQWNNNHKKKFFKRLINQRRTICTGYAYLIKELCFFANIECEIINGYGRTIDNNVESLNLINHSWNTVKLNDQWYLCDATWASGYLDEKGYFIKEYNDGYFLTEPNLFEKNHIPEDSKWALKTNSKETKKIFPLVYGETFKLNIDPILPNEMINRFKVGEEITFSYKSSNSEYITSLVELIGSREIPFEIYNIQKKDDITSFMYKFNKKGNYDVHLKINDYIVVTYIIKIVD